MSLMLESNSLLTMILNKSIKHIYVLTYIGEGTYVKISQQEFEFLCARNKVFTVSFGNQEQCYIDS